MKKVLILGAKGTLGQALVDVFQSQYEVISWDREDINIEDEQQTRKKLFDLNADIIINATALNAVDKIEEDAETFRLAENINGRAVGVLALIAKELQSIFVHYSTDYVFDGEKENPYIETDVPNPLSKYAQTKLLGEKLAQENCEKFYIIRLSRLFGHAGSSEMSKRSFVDMMIDLAEEKEYLEVIDDQTASPTYAPDLAHFTLMLVKENFPFGIYHGANAGGCTWYEWTKKIFEIRNMSVDLRPVSVAKFPRPAQAPKYSVLYNTKTSLQRTWESALQEYLA